MTAPLTATLSLSRLLPENNNLNIVGSSLKGLGSNTSDVDMCLLLPDRIGEINQPGDSTTGARKEGHSGSTARSVSHYESYMRIIGVFKKSYAHLKAT